MKYTIYILRRAQKELTYLPAKEYEALKNAIWKLAENPRPKGCKKLKGREGWRLHLGNYRIIYEISDSKKSVLILHIGHRKDVYR